MSTTNDRTCQMISLSSIPTDGACQARVSIRSAVVREYARAMTQQQAEDDVRFPAIVLFTDGTNQWLGDGFHRVLAAREAGLSEILAETRPGTHRDALLYSISCNSEHGLQRTNADKRNAVTLLLADPEWSQWSDREIARRCCVSTPLVSKLRRGASVNGLQIRQRKVRRGGRIYEMAIDKTGSEVPNGGTSVPVEEEVRAAPPAIPVDGLGNAVPEMRLEAFAVLPAFAEAQQLLAKVADLIDGIARKPGGEVYRQQLIRKPDNGRERFECADLRAAMHKLLSTEPYCGYCPSCHLAHPGFSHPDCKSCQGRGWTTQAAFEVCPEGHRREFLRQTMNGGRKPDAKRA